MNVSNTINTEVYWF